MLGPAVPGIFHEDIVMDDHPAANQRVERRPCLTQLFREGLAARDPAFRRAAMDLEQVTRLQRRVNAAADSWSGVVKIPVVVHVVWNTPAQNLSDAQIATQIEVLNRDFRKLNADVSTVPSAFLPFAADARIEFEL